MFTKTCCQSETRYQTEGIGDICFHAACFCASMNAACYQTEGASMNAACVCAGNKSFECACFLFVSVCPCMLMCAWAFSEIVSVTIHSLSVLLYRTEWVCRCHLRPCVGVCVCDVDPDVFEHLGLVVARSWPMPCAMRESNAREARAKILVYIYILYAYAPAPRCSRALHWCKTSLIQALTFEWNLNWFKL